MSCGCVSLRCKAEVSYCLLRNAYMQWHLNQSSLVAGEVTYVLHATKTILPEFIKARVVTLMTVAARLVLSLPSNVLPNPNMKLDV